MNSILLFVLACGRLIMPCSDRGALSLCKASVGTPLGVVLNESLKIRGVTDEAQLKKALKAPLRAPVVIAVLLKFKDHPKVERNEQIGSAAAATYAMSLAANALGFGSMWRTGLYATDPHVISALGGGDKDEVIGFLYLGTREGPSKLTPALDPEDFITHF